VSESFEGRFPPRHHRHFLVLIDGTWVSASQQEISQSLSNIYQLNLAIDTHNHEGETQITFYFAGLGSGNTIKKLTGGVLARGLQETVELCYINIVSNYVEGDQIYIFGFSRGAMIARIVADMISKCGILRSEKIGLFPNLWEIYIRNRHEDPLSHGFFEGNCYTDIKIDILGVLDPVLGEFSEKGSEELKRIIFDDRTVPKKVLYGLQLLAIHETRAEMKPVLWTGAQPHQNFEHIWMPGVHSDVGGTYIENFLGKVALLTILDRLTIHTPLRIMDGKVRELKDEIRRDLRDNRVIIHDECDTLIWRALSYNPFSQNCRSPGCQEPLQFYHPICKRLEREYIQSKSKKNRVLFSMRGLPLLPQAEVSSFDEICV